MKFLTALLVVLGSVTAMAATNSGASLKSSVLKMGTCYGINQFQGYTVDFYADNTATVSAWDIANLPQDEFGDVYIPAAQAKSKYAADGKVTSSYNTSWVVKGSSVYIDGYNKSTQGWDVSLLIGFRSETCNLILSEN